MTNILLVNRKDANVGLADFMSNLTTLANNVEDKDQSIIVCENLPDDWCEGFRSLGQDSEEIFVAWVQFHRGMESFNMGFVAWSRELLLTHAKHVGEEIAGGELESFETSDTNPDAARALMGLPPRTLH